MYSLNVPVPGGLSELAWEWRSSFGEFDVLRDELTLVVKRLEATTAGEFAADERAVREAIRGIDPFEVSIEGLDVFEDPPAGPAPVLYIAIESEGIERLHHRLVDQFGAMGPIEGKGYVPHITLARGTDPSALEEVLDQREVPTHEWMAERLVFWDARRELPVSDVSLPA